VYHRLILTSLLKRFSEPRNFIQVLAGPRQTGKTTLSRQVLDELKLPGHYASADEPLLKGSSWLEQQWETARALLRYSHRKAVLVLDEIQKIPHWPETVKRLWEEDSRAGNSLYIVILGSSQLLVQKGLTESLAGRFEITPVTHWSFDEMHAAFGWNIDEYIFYGGYPGSAGLIKDYERWMHYIKDSLIETTVSKDILLMTRVDKPTLLRRLFELGIAYSGQVLSYQKMLGQLQDAGNTVTLAHYLELLGGAGLLTGLSKYAGQTVRQRASSPKFVALNTALISAQMHQTFEDVKSDREAWGRLVESAVGAGLANAVKGTDIRLYYWAGGNVEVDYVLTKGERIIAIEVKSGRKKGSLPGIEKFSKEFPVTRKLLVGEQGIPLKEFFKTPVQGLFAI